MTNLYYFFILLLAITAVDVDANSGDIKATQSECVKFDKKRVEWLYEVAKDGSVRGVNTLKPDEYETMTRAECDAKFLPETIKEFKNSMRNLVDRQKQLLSKHKEIEDASNHQNGVDVEHFVKQLEAEFTKDQGSGTVDNVGTLVIYAKRLFMEIFSAEGEAARLDVFAFMKLPMWKPLKIAFEISKIQSATLDRLINEDIWQQHLAHRYPKHENDDEKNNKQKDKKNNKKNSSNDSKDSKNNMEALGMRRAVIEGAGTNGLLAAFKLYYAGLDVDLVNDRVEYTRFQMVIYDPNWMCMFRYFLGTKFTQIFHSLGFVSAERGFIGIRFVEQAMKARLEELAQFVGEKKSGAENIGNDESAVGCLDYKGENTVGGQLNLHYGFSVAGLEETHKKGDKGFYAKLNSVRGKMAKLPVDLFLCMGGVGDTLREKLLGSAPVPRSKTANYTTGIYQKVHHARKINITEALPVRIVLKMHEMQTQLTVAKFDKLIGEIGTLLPPNVHDSFHEFTKQLIDSKDENEFVFIENWAYFSLSAKTPKPLEALFKAIKQQIEHEGHNTKTKELLEQFDRRLRWKWAEAAFNFAYYDKVGKEGRHNTSTLPEQFCVNIDENGDPLLPNEVAKKGGVSVDIVSIRSFDATVRMMENVAEERKPSAAKGTNSVVVAALGDALANTHFYTGSGMSIGRKGVEFLVKTLKALTSGKIKSKQEFVANLAGDLKNVAMDAVKLVEKMVPDVVLPVETKNLN